MITGDTFLNTMRALADCVCEELLAEDAEPCFCGVLGGSDVPLDYCSPCGDRCGQAWVRLVNIFPSSTFPVADEGAALNAAGCPPALAFTLEVGVVRCAPQPDSMGNAPTAEAHAAAVEAQMRDAAAVARAIECCIGIDHEYSLGSYEPVSAGDCLGGTWTVTFPATDAPGGAS